MSIDEDFPMSKNQVRVLVVGLVAMAVFGAALFGGVLPGLKPNYSAPSTVTVDGEPYYYTTVAMNQPSLFSNFTLPQTFSFHNLTFTLWLTDWGSSSGALLHGNGTEPNGTVSSFVLGDVPYPPSSATLYVSPDRAFAISWPGGPLGGVWVRLMVRA